MESKQITFSTTNGEHGNDLENKFNGRKRKSSPANVQFAKKYGSLRLRNAVNVEEIATEIQDNSTSDQTEDLRQMHMMTLTMRRNLRKTLIMRSQEQKRKSWTQFKYRVALSKKRFGQEVSELMYHLGLWHGLMKKIEGKFGSSVASYFVLLRWIFLINIPIFFLVFCFIVIPQIIFRWYQQYPAGYTANSVSFSGWDLLTGGGWFRETELYYGYYHDDVITANDYDSVNNSVVYHGSYYSMPYAYFFTIAGYFVLNAIILGASLLVSYVARVMPSGQESNIFLSFKIFCEWDFNICRLETAKLKQKALVTEIQMHLSALNPSRNVMSCCAKCSIIIIRLLVNICVLCIIAGSAYLIWYLCNSPTLATTIPVISDLAMPICFTAIVYIIPYIFSYLAGIEKYHSPRTGLYFTIARSILLILVSFGALLAYLYNRVSCKETADDVDNNSTEIKCIECWETFIGEQIYRLMLMNFIFTLLTAFFVEFIFSQLTKLCCKNGQPPEFNIAHSILILVYSQILVWFGTFYSPLLGLITLIQLFIIFYIRGISALQNCSAMKKPWHSGRTHNIVIILLCVTFMYCLLAVGYSIGFLNPSRHCGPFTAYTNTLDIINGLLTDWQAIGSTFIIKTIVEIIASSAFAFFVFACLLIGTYYCYIAVDGYREVAEMLTLHLQNNKIDHIYLKGQLVQ